MRCSRFLWKKTISIANENPFPVSAINENSFPGSPQRVPTPNWTFWNRTCNASSSVPLHSTFKLVATKSAVSSSSVRKGSPLGPSFPFPEVVNGPLLGHTFLIPQVPTNQCFARHAKFSLWTRGSRCARPLSYRYLQPQRPIE